MSPLNTASITLAALLILTIPVCTSAPAEVQKTTTDQRQLFSKIEAVCSSYLSADLELWASDALGELCVMMLVQKSKELKLQEKSKRDNPGDTFTCHNKTNSRNYMQSDLVSFPSITVPEEREDSRCTLRSRDPVESRAEVTSSIGHEMEDDP